MSILFAILLFSFLIFIHELGHFLAAKSFGVQVNEFSMFMGPAIWKKQKGETLYAIRCIPIGGYCAMEGEDGESDNPRSFSHAAWYKRLVILVAGAAMNFLTGVVLIAILYAPAKQFVLPVIQEIAPECAFSGEVGIQPGDQLYALDGERIYTSSDFTTLLTLNPGDVHDLTVVRDGEKLTFEDLNMPRVEITDENGNTQLRYGFSFTLVEANFAQRWKFVWNSSWDMVRIVKLSLKMLFTGQAGLKDMSGPVGIVSQMSQVAQESSSTREAIQNLTYYGAMIAINLAVMNLLPIPALDGGRVVGLLLTTAIEGITRKKLNPKIEAYIHAGGMILLLALMAIIMFKDIFFIFKR